MSAKFFLYLFSFIVVAFSIDSVNISVIFKKNRNFQAKVFYFILALCMTELLAEFLYNIFETSKFF